MRRDLSARPALLTVAMVLVAAVLMAGIDLLVMTLEGMG